MKGFPFLHQIDLHVLEECADFNKLILAHTYVQIKI
jgi:hypothetical protein